MGIVCLGRHAQLDQPVAIKFLRRALSGRPSVVQRFLNEARALAALRSEHVVRVMDVGQLDSGRPYLVMEHLDGIDLDGLVDRDGRAQRRNCRELRHSSLRSTRRSARPRHRASRSSNPRTCFYGQAVRGRTS